MLFAAGLGTRMKALTANTPKPLLPVSGRTLLARSLDVIRAANLSRIVVNTHYLAGQIEAAVADQPDVLVSREHPDLLDTGGGLKKALPLLGPGPVFTLNSDSVWTGPNPLKQLRDHWDPQKMDALLLLVPKERATGHLGAGDFTVEAQGRLTRGADYIYPGAQIISTDGLKWVRETAFSLNIMWDSMLLDERVYGVVHPGGWCDVGHPGGIALAEEMLREAGDV